MTDRDSGKPVPEEASEHIITNELARAAGAVISTLDPETPLASLILWDERAIKAEKTAVRYAYHYAIRHKNPNTAEIKAEVGRSVEAIDSLPLTPEAWVEFLQALDTKKRKGLLFNVRSALMPSQGTAHDYSLKIGQVPELLANKKRLKPRERFAQIMFGAEQSDAKGGKDLDLEALIDQGREPFFVDLVSCVIPPEGAVSGTWSFGKCEFFSRDGKSLGFGETVVLHPTRVAYLNQEIKKIKAAREEN